MQSNSMVRGLLVGLACLLLNACWSTSTSVEHTWTQHTPRTSQLKQVVTMFGVRDGVLRRIMEDRMAQRLLEIGVRSIPAYRVLTEEDRSSRGRTVAKLRAIGYDGVIVTRVISEPANAPEGFDAFVELSWPNSHGDLGTVATVVRMETSAYSLWDNQLVWSALTKTEEPEDVQHLIDEVTSVLARALVRGAVVEESESLGQYSRSEHWRAEGVSY
jgi:hypothetical protein